MPYFPQQSIQLFLCSISGRVLAKVIVAQSSPFTGALVEKIFDERVARAPAVRPIKAKRTKANLCMRMVLVVNWFCEKL